MTFSVATSWLLPMNDRPHVKVSISVPGDVAGSEKAHELSEYFRTLPEYSIVEVVCFSGGIKAAPTGASRYGYVGAVVYGKEHTSKMPFDNLIELGFSYEVVDGSEVTEGVGYEIAARDVQRAVIRVVPDMTEIRTQEDLGHYMDELMRVQEEAYGMISEMSEDMPDGSLLELVAPYVLDEGEPVILKPGVLCDCTLLRAMVYHGEPVFVLEVTPEPYWNGEAS